MELFDLLALLLVLLPILLLFLFNKNGSSTTALKSYPLVGILPYYIKNRHRFLDWISDALVQCPNHTITIKGIGGGGTVITANPAVIEHVVKTNFANYSKGENHNNTLQDFLGHGILNSDGDDWKWQRKASTYEFNKRSLRNFVVEIVQYEIVHRLLPFLENAAKKEELVDLQDVLERFGFDTICKVAFNEDPASLTEESMRGTSEVTKFLRAFNEAQSIIVGRFRPVSQLVWRIKRLLNIGSEKKLKQAISIVHTCITDIIETRMVKPEDYNNLLSRYASIKGTSNDILRDLVVNYFLAGRETTSSSLIWFFWILSKRPDVREKIVLEIQSIRASYSNKISCFGYDELREMHYLHAAITESMRLFPPIPTDSVRSLNADTLPDGSIIGKGWLVTYSSYAMGRQEDIWGKDCNEYKPERWLENGVFKPQSPFRYTVFHAGPRICLGKEMGYIQMKSFVACVLERFEVDVSETHLVPKKLISATMKMKGGLPVLVKEIIR